MINRLCLLFVLALPFPSYARGEMVSREDREKTFTSMGLQGDLAGMDEMDRDLLLMDAGSKPLEELKKKYPTIPHGKLDKLRQAAHVP